MFTEVSFCWFYKITTAPTSDATQFVKYKTYLLVNRIIFFRVFTSHRVVTSLKLVVIHQFCGLAFLLQNVYVHNIYTPDVHYKYIAFTMYFHIFVYHWQKNFSLNMSMNKLDIVIFYIFVFYILCP